MKKINGEMAYIYRDNKEQLDFAWEISKLTTIHNVHTINYNIQINKVTNYYIYLYKKQANFTYV